MAAGILEFNLTEKEWLKIVRKSKNLRVIPMAQT
jgi:hypothetical protein